MIGFGWIARIGAWLAGIDLNNILGSITRIYEKRADTALGKEKVAGEVAVEFIKSDVAHINARKDLGLAAMTHPVWWAAWVLFVIPVGVYEGMIFYVSTFDMWLNTPGCTIPAIGEAVERGAKVCEWYVRRVPADQRANGRIIILSIFSLQGAAGITGAIIQRFFKK